MPSLNRIILIGRPVADPESRLTVEGVAMAKFRLAVTRPQAGTNNTDYIDVVAWQKVAEVCGQYVKKGKQVLVEGRIQVRTYEDQMGVRKWATEVVAKSINLIDGTPTNVSSPAASKPQAEEVVADDEGLAGDLPF